MRTDSIWKALLFASAMMMALAVPLTVHADDMDFGGGDDGGDDMDFGGGDDGGDDMDFGGGGADGGAATAMYAADPNSPTYKSMMEGVELANGGKCVQATLLFDKVLKSEDDTGKALAAQAQYEMGRCLYGMGFYQSALSRFNKVLQAGEQSEFFMPTLQWLVLLSRELPGDPDRATRIRANYGSAFPEQIEDALLADVGILMGQAAYKAGDLDDAIFFLGHVDSKSPLFGKARFIEGVTFVRKFNGEQALESYKDILRWVQESASPTKEQLRMQELAIAALGRVFYQVGHNLWVTDERPKAVQSWNTAIKYYSTFDQRSPHWLDSLFEASWTYYRVDDFNRALGLLHSLNSPFFNDEYYPEAMLLQAQIYYTNCHFDRVMYILDEFKQVYPPLKESLETELVNLIQPSDVYAFLEKAHSGEGTFNPTTKQVLNAALQDRELRRMMNYIDQLSREADEIRNYGQGWSGQGLAQELVADIDFTRQFAQDEAGNAAKARLERVLDELSELNNKALDIEIETTEKFASSADLSGIDPNAVQEWEREIDAMLSADDEHLFWTFDGEYWRDELGYYLYYLTSRCGR